MKNIYEKPDLTVVMLKSSDVIRLSGELDLDDTGTWKGSWSSSSSLK